MSVELYNLRRSLAKANRKRKTTNITYNLIPKLKPYKEWDLQMGDTIIFNLDDKVLVDMKNVIDKENLNEENSKKYEDILKKQYTDLSYEITNEDYNGDEATITVKVNVYDLYKAQKDATTYLAENPNEFKDEDGKYDAEKFITYKLDKMKETNEKTSYTIDFYVVNTSDGWTVSSLSNSDIEKLHGIYDYES